MSIWNSLTEISSIVNILKWIVAICGIITATSGVLLIVLSDRKDTLKKQTEEIINLKHDSTLTVQKNEIDSLKIEIIEQEKANKELKEEHEITKEKLSDTEEKLAPRLITEEQKKQFLMFLNDKPKGMIEIEPVIANPEARAFAKIIMALLIEVGYSVTAEAVCADCAINGLGMWVAHEKIPHAGFLQQAFNKIGINCPGYIKKNFKGDRVILIVGHKDLK